MFKDEVPANREQSKQQHFKVVATLSNFFSLFWFCSGGASFFAPFVLAFRSACSNKNKRIPSHPRPSPPCVRQFCLFAFWFFFCFRYFRVGRPGPADIAKGYWNGRAITQRVFKCSTFICIPLERVLYIQSEVSNVRVTNCWVKLTSFWLGTVFLCVAAGPPNRFFKYGQSRDQTYIHVFMNGVDNLRTVFSVHLNVHDLTPRRLFFTNAKHANGAFLNHDFYTR